MSKKAVPPVVPTQQQAMPQAPTPANLYELPAPHVNQFYCMFSPFGFSRMIFVDQVGNNAYARTAVSMHMEDLMQMHKVIGELIEKYNAAKQPADAEFLNKMQEQAKKK